MGTITRLPFRKGSKKTIQTSPDMKLLSAVTESELCIFPSSSLNICIFPFAHHSMKTHHCHLCIKIFKMFQATNIFYRKQTLGSQQCTKQSATSSSFANRTHTKQYDLLQLQCCVQHSTESDFLLIQHFYYRQQIILKMRFKRSAQGG